jgi:transcriptional regulator with XRE-family HTH domain
MDRPADQDKLRRLAEAVSARRAQLGRAQEALPAHGGPSGRTVRAIEQVQLPSFTAAILAKLDRGLDWNPGQSARILSGEADEAEIRRAVGIAVVTMDELGRRVLDRRKHLRMSQADLAAKGDFSEASVRRIEKGELTTLRTRTKRSLEAALQWRDGLVDDILADTATERPLNEVATPCPCGGQIYQRAHDLLPLLEELVSTLRAALQSL